MKILYVITKANWGGAQRYVYDLATAAKEAGHDVTVATGGEGLLTERLQTAGVRVIPLPMRQRSSFLLDLLTFGSLFSLMRLMKKERPDVVHVNSAKASGLGALAARLAGIPRIIFTAHGWAFNEDRSLLARLGIKFFSWLTMLFSTVTIAVSAAVRDRAPRLGIGPSKLALVRLGIRASGYASKEAAREALIARDESLRDKAGAFWVGTVGELHPNKGIDIGITGWQQAGLAAEWVIVGDGKDAIQLRTLASDMSSIHFLGFVDAAQYMKAFDLLLVPSRTEGLAYVILEAGFAHVPVLCSGVGGTKEALGPSYPAEGYFAAEDPAALSRALKLLAEDAETRACLADMLQAHVQKEFALNRMVRETFAVYT
jgi:glycosyltransferase involved in cell wall biosynthesis